MGAARLEGLLSCAGRHRRNGPQASHLRSFGCHVDERAADNFVAIAGGVAFVRLTEPATTQGP